MKKNDAIGALAFLALGATALIQTTRFDQTLITDNYLGATFFPRMVSLGMIAIALVVLVGAIKGKDEVKAGSPKGAYRTTAGAIAIALYAWGLEPLGFIISTAALNLVILVLFGVKKPSLLLVLPISVTFTIYWVFYKLLMVPLPEGIFFL
nr:tripartite tricarboxylate transporter TctB family protein [uncultured Dethiosulfovibrio sp.]